MHALVTAQNFIISGIEFLLEHSKLNITIPCHSGNHARTTKTTRFTTENGHSLEYLMYLHLAAYFRTQPRVKFLIPEGYHPVGAPAGYDCYYLNVMAGPNRFWVFKNDPNHEWMLK